jgi:hypothetical protein
MPAKRKYNVTIGQNFGNLTVISEPYIKDTRLVDLQCKCGVVVHLSPSQLYRTNPQSCKSCRVYSRGSEHKSWSGVGNIPGRLINRIKFNAKNRNIPFQVSNDYLWKLYLEQNKKCAISDIELHFETEQINFGFIASLDRIDSMLGYVENNVRWIYTPLNIMKNCYSDEYFYLLCNLVANKHKVELSDKNLEIERKRGFNYGKHSS